MDLLLDDYVSEPVAPSLGASLFAAGRPKISVLSENLLAPFIVHKLKNPTVLWLNRRRLHEMGIDATEPSIYESLCSEIVENYAFVVKTDGNAGYVDSCERRFYADRYGASRGSQVGGSGRCGISGDYNVKGIGRTPLAGAAGELDWVHLNGCVWLDEALREAVVAEVIAAEFPHGAIAPLAIIDTGIPAEATWGKRTALILRENFVRIAHLERSVFFGPKTGFNDEQYADALRAEEVNKRILEPEIASLLSIKSSQIGDIIRSVCDQIAFSYLHRFYLGSLSSSNISIGGALVDFGGVTSLPNWKRSYVQPVLPPFTADTRDLNELISSLLFYRAKYTGTGSSREELAGLIGLAQEYLTASFKDYILEAFGMSGKESAEDFKEFVETVVAFFLSECKIVSSLKEESYNGWVLKYLCSDGDGEKSAEAARLSQSADKLKNGIDRLSVHMDGLPVSRDFFFESFKRLLTHRHLMNWDFLTSYINYVVKSSNNMQELSRKFDYAFAKIVSRSRRVWRQLPARMLVLAQWWNPEGYTLYTYDTSFKKFGLMSVSNKRKGHEAIKGTEVNVSNLDAYVDIGNSYANLSTIEEKFGLIRSQRYKYKSVYL